MPDKSIAANSNRRSQGRRWFPLCNVSKTRHLSFYLISSQADSLELASVDTLGRTPSVLLLIFELSSIPRFRPFRFNCNNLFPSLFYFPILFLRLFLLSVIHSLLDLNYPQGNIPDLICLFYSPSLIPTNYLNLDFFPVQSALFLFFSTSCSCTHSAIRFFQILHSTS